MSRQKMHINSDWFLRFTQNWGQSVNLQVFYFYSLMSKSRSLHLFPMMLSCIRWKLVTLLWLEEPPGGATEPRFVTTARKKGKYSNKGLMVVFRKSSYFSFVHCTGVKSAILLSNDQTSKDRNSPEERDSVRAGLATPTTLHVDEKDPEVSSRPESHPRRDD